MINFFNVNPFTEAMLYYWGRANDYRTEKRLAEVCSRYPAQKEALEQAVQPAFLLEKLLDSKLNADEKLLTKFFKTFDNRKTNGLLGFCLASVMVSFPLMEHPDYSPAELCKYLRECSEKEQKYSFCFGLIDEYEGLNKENCGMGEISERIEKLTVSFENKWKILNAAVNYDRHIDELLSLIMPAAELIQAAENEYRTAVEKFHAYYSDEKLHSSYEHKLEHFDVLNVAPLIFGFNQTFFIAARLNGNEPVEQETADDCVLTTNMLIGIACRILSGSSRGKIKDISNKLKTLSDSSRLEILFYLCSHRAYGQELCGNFNIQQSTLSYHMSKLVVAGLVKEEVSGGRTYYSADKKGIQSIIDAFAEKIK